MTDEGAPLQPGTEEITVPFRPRAAFAGYRAFGSGDGAVLVAPRVARELRSAAESATQERRVTGGLLFGRGWVDDQGAYMVIDGFVEAGPGENYGDRISADGADEFTLSEADLRLLRQDAARMYSAELELGWWRTRAAPGEFGPRDLTTQAELVGPDGVGLLVYGSGIYWGTAYLGPDGRAPDTAGTLAVTADADAEPPDPGLAPDLEDGLGPGPEVVDIAGGESLLDEEPPPAAGPPPADVSPGRRAGRRLRQPREPRGPRQPRQRAYPRVRVPRRPRAYAAAGPENAGYRGPETPGDVQFVVIALAIAVVAAAIIVGALVHSVIVAVIIAAVGLLAVFSTVWMSRH